jgi:hypothetical protein
MMSGKPLAMVPVSKPSRGKLVRGVRRLLFDFSLYVLIALGIGATTIFYASVGPDEPALLRAIPFFAYTIALFGYLLQTRRRQWRVIGLWYAAAISFAGHLFIFILVFRVWEWRPGWYVMAFPAGRYQPGSSLPIQANFTRFSKDLPQDHLPDPKTRAIPWPWTTIHAAKRLAGNPAAPKSEKERNEPGTLLKINDIAKNNEPRKPEFEPAKPGFEPAKPGNQTRETWKPARV